jgi:hypothetical protein
MRLTAINDEGSCVLCTGLVIIGFCGVCVVVPWPALEFFDCTSRTNCRAICAKSERRELGRDPSVAYSKRLKYPDATSNSARLLLVSRWFGLWTTKSNRMNKAERGITPRILWSVFRTRKEQIGSIGELPDWSIRFRIDISCQLDYQSCRIHECLLAFRLPRTWTCRTHIEYQPR